ncbi:PilZ domain-containing protein [Bacteriovorax sp. Seq25_V]|uniref:PilZ domain-containing protein n=1 Tax=Bacteriovorax sp. Seq25_V TaxID=1201288 RepID=UPI00038A3F3A|nr:PilZ domain-containing protein [Bacteriovorax sp. Seq25_V]EQC43402.1 hypothetical protein M900_2783 [Bacteriovorax sp. Seq25_V]
MENFKWEEDRLAIKEVLDRALIKLENIIIWQATEAQKIIHNGFILEHNEDANSIILSKVKKLKSFKEHLPVYLKFMTRSMLIKGKMKRETKEFVVIELPDRIKLIENRQSKRTKVDDSQNVLFEKVQANTLGKSRFSFELLDISDSGLGLKMSDLNVKLLTAGDKFRLIKMQGKEIKIKIYYRIVHISPGDIDRHGKINSYIVGMKKEGDQ